MAESGDNNDGYAWEQSGYYEGDIVDEDTNRSARNGLRSEDLKWPNAVVPYVIDSRFCKYNFYNFLFSTGNHLFASLHYELDLPDGWI